MAARVAALALVTAAGVVAHWPVLSARALCFDDEAYFVDNWLVQNPSWQSAATFFREVFKPSTVGGYYQPLTMISLMLDYAAGARPDDLRQFHLTNLTLHVCNALLIVVLLDLLFGRPWVAAAAGLLFAVHPLTVEPIAWVSERKTLLASFFALWTLVLYVAFVRTRRRSCLVVAGLTFVLAVLAKPTTTPLPVVALLLDWWPLRRLNWRAVLEKIPLLAISVASAIITGISQSRAAWVASPAEQSFGRILLILGHNVVFYAEKAIWPANLTPHNPFPAPLDLTNPRVLLSLIATLVLLAVLAVSLRWTRAACAGWLIFLAAIFPTMGAIGFTNVIASDKYAYFPALGWLLLLAAGLGRLWDWCGQTDLGRNLRRLLPVAVVGLMLVQIRATRGQLALWANSETLGRHMLALAPYSPIVHNALAGELLRSGRLDEAARHCREALRFHPQDHKAHTNLGNILAMQQRWEEAVAHLEEAARLKPDYDPAYNGLGAALADQGKLDEAIPHFERALAINPHNADACCNLGNVLAARGRLEEAASRFAQAIGLRHNFPEAHNNLANVLWALGKPEQAIPHYREAIRLKPALADAYYNLARLLASMGRHAEAAEALRSGLRQVPGDARLIAGLRTLQPPRSATSQP